MVAICFTLGGCTADDQESGSSVAILGPEAERNAETGTFPFILSPTDTTVHPVLSGTFDGENPGDEPEVVPIMVQVLDPPPPGLDVDDVMVEFRFFFHGEPDTLNFTGGHEHPRPGDDLPARPRGQFLTSEITPNDFEFVEFVFESGAVDSSLVVQADATGLIVVPYQTSGIGGIEKVYISASDVLGYVAAPTEDSVTITVRIGEFEELAEGPGIELVGETGSHPSNHWATGETIGYVETVAAGMAQRLPGIQLEVNDMNLEFGGVFDCAQPDSGCPGLNPWGPPHETHKVGIQVDFNLDNDPEPMRSDTARAFRRELESLPIEAKVWDRETSHHHVTFCPATGEVDGFVINACQ